jgi:hypothetical protein
MIPIDFEITRSKVKVTGALTKKACPSNNLRFLLILGDCVKGQGHRNFTIISLSAQILKNACSPCIDVDIFTFEACGIHKLAMYWLNYLRFGREVVHEL